MVDLQKGAQKCLKVPKSAIFADFRPFLEGGEGVPKVEFWGYPKRPKSAIFADFRSFWTPQKRGGFAARKKVKRARV
jgi:hypothetical protein